MTTVPPEDLIVAARILDTQWKAIISEVVWLTEPANDWRDVVPDPIKRLWGRLEFESRIVAWMLAESAFRDRQD